MALIFDKLTKCILIEDPQTEVTIQALYDAIRDYEDNPENLEVDKIANAQGKAALGGGDFTAITLELIDDWRIQFEDRGGPGDTVCKVTNGNLIATNSFSNNPVKPSTNTYVILINSTAPALPGLAANVLTVSKYLALKDT